MPQEHVWQTCLAGCPSPVKDTKDEPGDGAGAGHPGARRAWNSPELGSPGTMPPMTEVSATEVTIYTDGACKGNPGPGGWGCWLSASGKERELFGGAPQTTNNRMELTAVIKGLSVLTRRCSVAIYTDSEYVRNGITTWIHGWKKRGWRTADGKPVKNVELWQQLETLANAHDVQWHWVRGHNGDPGNERADALANKGVLVALNAQA
jgi:ribonuclease HI